MRDICTNTHTQRVLSCLVVAYQCCCAMCFLQDSPPPPIPDASIVRVFWVLSRGHV